MTGAVIPSEARDPGLTHWIPIGMGMTKQA